MTPNVVVLDYGLGNVQSVANAVEWLGTPVRVTSDVGALEEATHVILPGVGSFTDGMQKLKARGLDRVLTSTVLQPRKPFLGICLGMQLLADYGEEGAGASGLGWVPGRIARLDVSRHRLKLPHIGWDDVVHDAGSPLYDGLQETASFYFVHSYQLVPEDAGVVSGWCEYGVRVCASIQQGHVFGTQFHPEKSQRHGMQVLQNFVQFTP